jgi:hypothetical protein
VRSPTGLGEIQNALGYALDNSTRTAAPIPSTTKLF